MICYFGWLSYRYSSLQNLLFDEKDHPEPMELSDDSDDELIEDELVGHFHAQVLGIPFDFVGNLALNGALKFAGPPMGNALD